jgi:hypothetical protein
MTSERCRKSRPIARSEDEDPTAVLRDAVVCGVNYEGYWLIVGPMASIDRSEGALQHIEALVLVGDMLASGVDALDVL